MKNFLHFFKKDYASVRPWLWATWGILLLHLIVFRIEMNGASTHMGHLANTLLPRFFIFLTTLHLFQQDAFLDSSGFLASRPIPRLKILAFKTGFVALALLFPAALAHFAAVHLLGIHPSLADAFLYFLEYSLPDALFAGAGILLGMTTRKPVVALALMLVLILLYLRFHFTAFRDFHQFPENRNLIAGILLEQNLLWLAVITLIACGWTIFRRRALPLFVGILLGFAGYSEIRKISWNPVEPLIPRIAIAEILDHPPEIILEEKPNFGSNSTRDGERYFTLRQQGKLRGLKEGWEAKVLFFDATAKTSSGSSIISRTNTLSIHDFGGARLDSLVLPRFGITPHYRFGIFSHPGYWPLFDCKTKELPPPGDTLNISGNATFRLYQPQILGELPLKENASVLAGRFRYRISQIQRLDSRASLSISAYGLPLASRGDRAAMGDVEFLVLNPVTKQFASPPAKAGGGSTGDSMYHFNVNVSLLSSRENPPTSEDLAVFLKDAKVYIVGKQEASTVTLPYEIPEITLEK
ncbi:MAG: hypothetical protein QM627_06645 [Luteolibacter sp.]